MHLASGDWDCKYVRTRRIAPAEGEPAAYALDDTARHSRQTGLVVVLVVVWGALGRGVTAAGQAYSTDMHSVLIYDGSYVLQSYCTEAQ